MQFDINITGEEYGFGVGCARELGHTMESVSTVSPFFFRNINLAVCRSAGIVGSENMVSVGGKVILGMVGGGEDDMH